MRSSDEPSLEIAIRAIGNSAPPNWLEPGLRQAVAGLAAAFRDSREFPGRAEARKRLIRIAGAARLLVRELHDPAILSLLEHWADEENVVLEGMQSLKRRSLSEFRTIDRGRGRHKHHPRPTGMAPMCLCALIVSVAWHEARGEWPGQDNENSHAACEAVWRVATAAPRRQSLAVWRDHLRSASSYRKRPEAGAIRQGLLGSTPGRKPARTEK
jgi:hypothetical protein